MFFQQILRTDIGCAAYLIGSEHGDAAIVDPRIDMVEELLAVLEREHLRLRYIIETHNHADHVSGHHVLAARTGATIAVHAAAEVAYPHHPLRDGEELALDEVRLRVLHTPGHRPEHIALAVIDATRGEEPWLVLTGDSLFIGDVARPDLAIPQREGAATLYDSLRQRLLTLPDGTLVYPAHVAGSLCGRVTNRMTGSTIGYERANNAALRIADAAAFIRFTTENLPERPPNMAQIVERNRAAASQQTDPAGAPRWLTPQETRQALADGVLALDVRSVEKFAERHIPGALSVALESAQFPNRAGLVLPPQGAILLVAASDAQARQALTALSVIGRAEIVGALVDGMTAWQQAGYPVEALPGLSAAEVRARHASNDDQILDVRERSEWEAEHIPGSRNIPFHQLAKEVQTLDHTRPLVVICASGHRSTIAASILQAAGFPQVYNALGGMAAWRAEASRSDLVPAGHE